MSPSRVPVAGPWVSDLELRYTADAVANGWYEHAHDYTSRFETAFAEYVGVAHAVSLPSATAGIHLALAALGIGPGDEVIVPESTWIATSAPISYVGAAPVFVDIDPMTWCIDPQSFERAITNRTRAVIAVDLYGSVPDMDEIRRIAGDRGVAVIEDAAEAIGSEYRGRRAGALGDVGIFSFHGSKTLTTGEGGMLVTDRSDLFERILVLRDHGRRPGDTMFMNGEVAFKYKMSNLQAAFGLAQLERVEELVGRKRQIFAWYEQRLQMLPGVTINAEPAQTRNSYWMVTAIAPQSAGRGKAEIIANLREVGIDTRPFFNPLSSLDAYAERPNASGGAARNPVSYRLSETGINLPSALTLDEATVDFVCDAYARVLEKG